MGVREDVCKGEKERRERESKRDRHTEGRRKRFNTHLLNRYSARTIGGRETDGVREKKRHGEAWRSMPGEEQERETNSEE